MQGEVSEWSNEADSKSVIQLVVSGVQIPSSPPLILLTYQMHFGGRLLKGV